MIENCMTSPVKVISNHFNTKTTPKRNYDFPPNDYTNFVAIKNPAVLKFANTLRKKDRRKIDESSLEWGHLAETATAGYSEIGEKLFAPSVTRTPTVSPIKRKKKISLKNKKKKSPKRNQRTNRKSGKKRQQKNSVQFSFRTSTSQPIVFQYHYHVSEPSVIGRSLYALGSDRTLKEEIEYRDYKEKREREQQYEQYEQYLREQQSMAQTPSRMISPSALMTPYPPPPPVADTDTEDVKESGAEKQQQERQERQELQEQNHALYNIEEMSSILSIDQSREENDRMLSVNAEKGGVIVGGGSIGLHEHYTPHVI